MMLTNEDAVNPVHYPQKDRFEFDEEVAAIFENMATRSIPLYGEAHRLHAMIAETYISQQRNHEHLRRDISILDIGASVGGFVKALCNRLQCDPNIGPDGIAYHGTDPSAAMVEEFKRVHPWATVACCDASTPVGAPGGFDMALMMYVLQFVPTGERDSVLAEVYKSMRPGGILFLGQKERVRESVNPIFSMEYIRWRMDNGYSQKEIAAKTQALESVMWPESIEDTRNRLHRVGFKHVRETTRWLQFSTLMARR